MGVWVMAIVIGVAIYTFLFGLEQWRGKNYRGAIGVWILAIAPFALAAYYMVLAP